MAPVVVDLRSDTVTKPNDAMRAAMAAAEVGDDVLQEDPTVKALETRVAALLGHAAGLFVPSGTMANLLAVLVHCPSRGDEAIVGDEAHIFFYEQGGISSLGGVHVRTLPTNPLDGTLPLEHIAAAIRPPRGDPHLPTSRVVCLEQTHNRCGGTVVPLDYMAAVAALCRERGLRLHIDGARLLNAAVALDVAPAQLVAGADSVSFCLSKGLGAPVGSVLVGSSEFVAEARRLRKVLGGGMRQCGVIAAAGLVALDEATATLRRDHAVAQRLYAALVARLGTLDAPRASAPLLAATPAPPASNILLLVSPRVGAECDRAVERVVAELGRGDGDGDGDGAAVRVLAWKFATVGVPRRAAIRLVVNKHVADEHVELVVAAVERAVAVAAAAEV